ncbi:hypothetical protein M758_4G066900 [Ceratodon purpureus]|nr:hypothetical protein M758_4G066900 [Ceratodon purpureus]
MSQKMRFFGPKVQDPSRAAKDAMLKLAREQHRRDACNARLQDLEKELQIFSEEFGSRLHDLRAFMKDEIFTTPDLRPFSESLSPHAAKAEGLEFHGQDIENIH